MACTFVWLCQLWDCSKTNYSIVTYLLFIHSFILLLQNKTEQPPCLGTCSWSLIDWLNDTYFVFLSMHLSRSTLTSCLLLQNGPATVLPLSSRGRQVPEDDCEAWSTCWVVLTHVYTSTGMWCKGYWRAILREVVWASTSSSLLFVPECRVLSRFFLKETMTLQPSCPFSMES